MANAYTKTPVGKLKTYDAAPYVDAPSRKKSENAEYDAAEKEYDEGIASTPGPKPVTTSGENAHIAAPAQAPANMPKQHTLKNIFLSMPKAYQEYKKAKNENMKSKIELYNAKIAKRSNKLQEKLRYIKTKHDYNELRHRYFNDVHPFLAKLKGMGQHEIAHHHMRHNEQHFRKHAKRIGIKHRTLHPKHHYNRNSKDIKIIIQK